MTEFKDTITANGDKQWVDSYGVIKPTEQRLLRTYEFEIEPIPYLDHDCC